MMKLYNIIPFFNNNNIYRRWNKLNPPHLKKEIEQCIQEEWNIEDCLVIALVSNLKRTKVLPF